MPELSHSVNSPGQARGSPALEVLAAATRLGLTSFGGPVAHLGYFREEYVVRRQWLDERTYADLLALCQFLPGPASTELGCRVSKRRPPPVPGPLLGEYGVKSIWFTG